MSATTRTARNSQSNYKHNTSRPDMYILQHLMMLILLATAFLVLAGKVYAGDPSN